MYELKWLAGRLWSSGMASCVRAEKGFLDVMSSYKMAGYWWFRIRTTTQDAASDPTWPKKLPINFGGINSVIKPKIFWRKNAFPQKYDEI
jgi:hypothetical protein